MSDRLCPALVFPRARFVPGGDVPHPRKAGTLLEVAADDALAAGVDLFDAGFYWEAHEVWEGLWAAHGRAGESARVVQALIKVAAAGVKVLQRQPEGVTRHLDGARALLTDVHAWPEDLTPALRLADVRALIDEASAAPPAPREGPVFARALRDAAT